MKLYADTIQFENGRKLMKIAQKYFKQNLDEGNKSLNRFVAYLEVMDLAWFSRTNSLHNRAVCTNWSVYTMRVRK